MQLLIPLLAVMMLASPSFAAMDADFVKNVHVIYMNHLDVGYDGLGAGIGGKVGYINNVLNRYFQQYFPQAVKLAQQLNDEGYTETFIYTTHPWLLSMFLNCPTNLTLGGGVRLMCPDKYELGNVTDAIKKGWITWHAGPMNLQAENGVQWLFEYGLDIGADLDHMFNINRSLRVLSQRDVPGMSQAVIPSLVKKGVMGVSVGVNDASSPPAVPQIFRWQYAGQEVLATWHPGGYPDNPGPYPKMPGGLSLKDCVIIQNFTDALCFAFRTDNSGPPIGIPEVIGYYEILRKEFPNAKIMASTFENFFQAVQPIKSQLPVVTNEIGDNWIQGIASDPRKIAEFRAVARVMAKSSPGQEVNASRYLIKPSEHTWGLNTAQDIGNWSNANFHKYKSESKFVNATQSWLEQRNFTYLAVAALKDQNLAKQAMAELDALKPARPNLEAFMPINPAHWTDSIKCDVITIGFAMDGSISQLSYGGVTWATNDLPMARFIYNTYNQTDMDNFSKLYNYHGGSAGYIKNNVTASAHPESRTWPTALRDVYRRSDDSCDFYLHIQMVEKTTWQYYGAPLDIWIRHTVRTSSDNPGLDTVLQFFDKTSTRLAESLLFAYSVPAMDSYKWTMSKLGQTIDPLNVVLNGSQYQHALDDGGVSYMNAGKGVNIYSPDVALVCPMTEGKKSPPVYPAPLKPIDKPITGMAFNIYNNVWDTNYIFWYPYIDEDKDFKARFMMDIKA